MKSKTRRLVFSANPHPDESFIGYLIRLTEVNHYDTPSWILQLAMIGSYVRKVSLCFNNNLKLSSLAQLTGAEEDKLRSLLYLPVAPTGEKFQDYFVFGAPIPRMAIRAHRPKVCASCLLEYGYIRKLWDLTAVTTCPLHKCLLLDECPHCGRGLPLTRSHVSICHCEYDWRGFSPTQVNEAELEVTRRLHSLCNLPGGITPGEDGQVNPLNVLELKHLLFALFFFVNEYSAVGNSNRQRSTLAKLASSMRNADVHASLCKAVLVFDCWPSSYFSFLDWRRQNVSPTRHLSGLSRDFREYKYSLYKQLAAPAFDFMRCAFEEYITTVWDGGYVTGMSRLRNRSLEGKKYASRNEATKLRGVSRERIDLLLNDGSLRGKIRRQGRSRMLLIELDSIHDLKRTLANRQLLSAKQASKRLGTPYAQMAALNSRDFLQKWHLTHLPERFVYSLQEIDGLLKRLESCVSGKQRLSAKGIIGLNHALRSLRCCDLGLGELLELVLEGNLRLCGMNKRLGLSGLRFSHEEICEYVRQLQRKRFGKSVRIREAARLLGTDINVALSLVKKGLLTAYKRSARRRAVLMISERAISDFSSKYFLAANMAAELRTVSGYLIKILEEKGLKPISGKTIDGGKIYVFRKSDLAEIDLAALLRTKRESTTREMAKLINIDAAATFLQTNVGTILELLAAGLLKPYRFTTHKQRLNNDYYFTRHRLAKFRGKIELYRGLLSTGVAARMLDRHPNNFKTKYVRTKRIESIQVGNDKRHYFPGKSVERLIELDRQLIRSPEVARILNLSASQIFRWTVAGVLRPISGPQVDGYALNSFLRKDVEALGKARRSFRQWRIKEGGSSRFGSPAGPRKSPLLELISGRVKELVSEALRCGVRLTGVNLHRQLVDEGYQVGINSVHVSLRSAKSNMRRIKYKRCHSNLVVST